VLILTSFLDNLPFYSHFLLLHTTKRELYCPALPRRSVKLLVDQLEEQTNIPSFHAKQIPSFEEDRIALITYTESKMLSRTMNNRSPRANISSPNCVIRHHCLDGIPDLPDLYLQEESQRQVRFMAKVQVIHSIHTFDYEYELWWSRSEIRKFQKQAKIDAKDFRESNDTFVYDLEELFRASKSETSLQSLMRCPCARRIMEYPEYDMRGLERSLHSIVGQYRFFHCRSLLAIQKACPIEDSEYLGQLLRSRSIESSRASRVLARLLAHGDYLQTAEMIRQELDSLNSNV
jgi:hypothetical protein